MAEDQQPERADINLNLRLTKSQYQRFERLRERLQARVSENMRVTQKTVFLEALKALEGYYDKLERDKRRER